MVPLFQSLSCVSYLAIVPTNVPTSEESVQIYICANCATDAASFMPQLPCHQIASIIGQYKSRTFSVK